MNRSVFTTMVVGASLLFGGAMYAATPVAIVLPVHATVSHPKLVRFSLRNDSAEPIQVLAGTQAMTLLPGKTVAVKLPAGVNIVAAETTAKRTAGSVFLQVTSAVSDATVSLQ